MTHHGEWCITGPAGELSAGRFTFVQKKDGSRQRVRVEEILKTTEHGNVIASFSNPDLTWSGPTVRNPKRRGRSK